jgi:predicted metalloprotease with PDZ domain
LLPFSAANKEEAALTGRISLKYALTAISALSLMALAATAAVAQTECPSVPPPEKDRAYDGVIGLSVDVTDIQRRIFRVHETVPVLGGQDLVLLYPEWVPGTHAPLGQNRLNRFAGLVVTANNDRVVWTRDPCNNFAFHITPPESARTVDVEFQYLSPDGSQAGPAAGAEVTADIVILEWFSVILYPAGYNAGHINVVASLKLPDTWKYATALARRTPADAVAVAFEPVSLEALIDSPVFAGRYAKGWDLDPGAVVPVRLNLFADRDELLPKPKDDQLDADCTRFEAYRTSRESDLKIRAKMLEDIPVDSQHLCAHRSLIKEAYKLFGSPHYDHYDFLVTLSNNIPLSGVEHHRSSRDNVPATYFNEWDKTIFVRDLLPHEYTHSWNGKFRRPADLWTPNYNVPMRDSLLWVYEGQTQYWGQVLAARSGLWSQQQAREALADIAAYYKTIPGRRWRNLADTTYAPIITPTYLPQYWRSWGRSRDYYGEGLLVWLDADTLIRERSNGQHSLDDFAHDFFGVNAGSYTPLTYTFDDVVSALNAVLPYDWAKFLKDRLEVVQEAPPLDGIELRGGYRLVYTDAANDYIKSAETRNKDTNLLYSIGLTVGNDGKVKSVLWEGPAYMAGMSAGVQILAVNGVAFDADRLKEAIKQSGTTAEPIELILKDQDHFRTVRIDYHDGLHYPHLERKEGQPARLDDIFAAK